MQKIFETLIDSYVDNKVGIAENFLNESLAANLKDNLYLLYAQEAMKNAGTGNEVLILQNKLIRSDKIYWLDRNHNDLFENEFLDLIEQFVIYLNATCYTGITGFEFHYAMYETGSFYARHYDRFRNDDSRKFSMITYLNSDWIEGHGGELCIHHEAGHQQLVAPNNGKSVFFKSNELEHEVLLTHEPRMSITGWLKR
jgi:SM-20-related protein